MPDAKFLKCGCAHCGGRIEFPVDGIGATVPCPHCGRDTELLLETPAETSGDASRSRKWIIAGVIILALGIAGVGAALVAAKVLTKRAQERAAETRSTGPRARPAGKSPSAKTVPQSTPAAATVINDFAVSGVVLEKKPGSTLVYATGSLRNETERQRFNVTVEIDLLDGAGAKVGTAQDYKDVVEPRAPWTFRALLVVKNAASARVSAVREQ